MSFIIITVNDESTDFILHILKKMSKNDSRIKIINYHLTMIEIMAYYILVLWGY